MTSALRLVVRRLLAPHLPPDPAVYYWECACGARSRGENDNRSDVVYNAERHQWHHGVGHPMPDVLSRPERLRR